MGTENSNLDQSKEPKIRNFGSIYSNLSNYNGIISNSPSNSKSSSSSKKEEKSILEEQENNKVRARFEWNEGGNLIFITGTFCNWQQFFIMNKDKLNPDKYYLELELNEGAYQFKFKVDDQWRCSKNYPTIIDNGNENNYIELKKLNNIKIQPKKNSDQIIKRKSKKFNKFNKKLNWKNLNYSNYYPPKNQLNLNAPSISNQYSNSFNLDNNTKQNEIGKNIFMKHNEHNLLSENNSYKKIFITPHINLNHLISRSLYNRYSILSSMTRRIRDKYSTFVYYKPNYN